MASNEANARIIEKNSVGNRLYVAISMLKSCNLHCGYCNPFGENRVAQSKNRMTYVEFQRIADAAYDAGFTTFRLTGGECTLLPWFGNALSYLIEKDSSIRVNIDTNGNKIGRYLDYISKYRANIGIRLSLDALRNDIPGIWKYLSNDIVELLDLLSQFGIYARFNVVVLRSNQAEVPPLINLARNYGFDVKLLDLCIHDRYISTHSRAYGRDGGLSALEYWRREYVNLNLLRPLLSELSISPERSYNVDGGFGIPMTSFEILGNAGKIIRVILKDSSKGSHFSRSRCIEVCEIYRCQEGAYAVHISSNGNAHINGCYNRRYKFDLNAINHGGKVHALQQLMEFFDDVVLVATPPGSISQTTQSH